MTIKRLPPLTKQINTNQILTEFNLSRGRLDWLKEKHPDKFPPVLRIGDKGRFYYKRSAMTRFLEKVLENEQ